MRLLNVSNLSFEEFTSEPPPYTILSHTWGNGEVTYQDMINGTAQGKAGYFKITKICNVALEDGFDYVWVDTCCIDKTSSAELSEAINSMYRWYKEATTCFAYLADVQFGESRAEILNDFSKSRWFTRGWTLQELIAPSTVIFLAQNWMEIGSKSSLAKEISIKTKISTKYLLGDWDISFSSIAQRMSWAANRQTTREEDLAYCLMGLFDIHMPLLYGEGSKAFIRLQEEIIKTSDDQSIFVWRSKETQQGLQGRVDPQCQYGNLLAGSPSYFENSGNVITRHFKTSHFIESCPLTFDGRGLHCALPLRTVRTSNSMFGKTTEFPTIYVPTQDGPNVYLAALKCKEDGSGDNIIAIWLQRIPTSSAGQSDIKFYVRCQTHVIENLPSAWYFKGDRVMMQEEVRFRRRWWFMSTGKDARDVPQVVLVNDPANGVFVRQVSPVEEWKESGKFIKNLGIRIEGPLGTIEFDSPRGDRFFVAVKRMQTRMFMRIEEVGQGHSKRQWEEEPCHILKILNSGTKVSATMRKQIRDIGDGEPKVCSIIRVIVLDETLGSNTLITNSG